MVQFLLSRGISVDSKDDDGKEPGANVIKQYRGKLPW
jgi:hypothetical protein